jgi:hypothetical protein
MNSLQVVFWLLLGPARCRVAAGCCRLSGRHVITQVGERTNDAIVPPAGVLVSHFHNQCFDFGPDSWAAWIAAVFGTVEFAGDQPSVPCQDRVWLGNLGYLSQRFASETLTDLRQWTSRRQTSPSAPADAPAGFGFPQPSTRFGGAISG